jgi:O-antigen ligase/tetratricopeptide (TPR) repeat protein
MTDVPEGSGARATRVLLGATAAAVVLALYPFAMDTSGPVKWLCMAGGLLAAWSVFAASGAPLRKPGWTAAVLLAFVIWHGGCALMAFNPLHAAHVWSHMLMMTLAWVLASAACRSPGDARPVLAAYCAALAVCSLYAMTQRFGWDPFPWAYQRSQENYARLPGTLGNPNYAAHALAPGIAVSIYLALGTRKAARLWLLATALFLTHLVLTTQRGGIAGLTLAGGVVTAHWMVRRNVRRPAARVVTILLMVVLIPALAVALAMAWTHRQTGNPFPYAESLYIRYNSYDTAARMALDRPVAGFGPGHFETASPPYWTQFEQERFAREHRVSEHVHNEYLELATESGLPGLLLVTAFLTATIVAALWRAASSTNRDTRRLALLVAAVAVIFSTDALFGFNLRLPASGLVLFLLVGMAEGVWRGALDTPRMPAGIAHAARWSAVLVAALLTIAHGRVFLGEQHAWSAGQARLRDDEEGEVAALVRAHALMPWNWDMASETGAFLQRLGRHEEAAEVYRRALELNPTSFMALGNLAECGLRAGLAAESSEPVEEALAPVRRMLELCPGLPEALELDARCRHALAKMARPSQTTLWHRARCALTATLAADPPTPAVLHLMLAESCLSLDDPEAAEEAFAAGLAASPGDDALWQAWERHARDTRRQAVLLDTCAALIARHARQVPPDPALVASLHTRQARLRLRLLADPAGAEEACAFALANDSWHMPAWDTWTEAAGPEGVGRVREALKTRLLDAADPNALPPVFAAMRVYYAGDAQSTTDAGNRLSEALASGSADTNSVAWAAQWMLLELAHADLPEVEAATARHVLGRVLFETGRLEAAAAALQAAIPKLPRPGRLDCARLLAEVLDALGRPADAAQIRAALDQAAAVGNGGVSP